LIEAVKSAGEDLNRKIDDILGGTKLLFDDAKDEEERAQVPD